MQTTRTVTNPTTGEQLEWDVTCRSAGDWYATEYRKVKVGEKMPIIANNLPTREAAVEAGRKYYRDRGFV